MRGSRPIAGPRAPQRFTKVVPALLLAAAACLFASDSLPNWGGVDPRGNDLAQNREILNSPLTSDEKRGLVVSQLVNEIAERAELVNEVAEEDSPAGRDARRLREQLAPLFRKR